MSQLKLVIISADTLIKSSYLYFDSKLSRNLLHIIYPI